MYRDVAGIQGGHGVQGAAEARKAVCGQTRDEIHIDGVKAQGGGLLVAAEHVGCRVGPSTGPEDGVNHALGVDADPVGAVPPDGGELLHAQGVRAACFNGKLQTLPQIKGPVDAV